MVVKTAPSAPRTLKVNAKLITKKGATLTWLKPLTSGSAAISDYRVEYSTNGKTWKVLNHSKSTSTTFVVKTFKSKTRYYVRVKAVSADGVSAACKPVLFKTK